MSPPLIFLPLLPLCAFHCYEASPCSCAGGGDHAVSGLLIELCKISLSATWGLTDMRSWRTRLCVHTMLGGFVMDMSYWWVSLGRVTVVVGEHKPNASMEVVQEVFIIPLVIYELHFHHCENMVQGKVTMHTKGNVFMRMHMILIKISMCHWASCALCGACAPLNHPMLFFFWRWST